MKIGIDLRCLQTPRTGVGEYTAELLRHVFAIDTINEYFLFQNAFRGASSQPFTGSNIHYVSTRLPNKLLNLSTIVIGQPKLNRLLHKDLDVFFSPNLNFTAVSSTTKHLLMIHDIAFYLFPEHLTTKQRLLNLLMRPKKQAKNATTIITPSLHTKHDVMEHFGIPAEKITVIYPGASIPTTTSEDVRKKYGLRDNMIVSIGTTEPRKNILALVRGFEAAFPDLPTKHDLVIVGAPGWKQVELLETINNSPLKDHIKLLNYIDPSDKAALIKQAAVCVYPSWYEGFGLPVLEAMSAGTPVITSNRSSLLEVAGDACYLINPHHPLEIKEGLLKLLKNQEFREEKIKKGLVQAQHFQWKRAAEEWLKLLV